jgi:glutamate-1-semialdehyde 2,1-aminomutase
MSAEPLSEMSVSRALFERARKVFPDGTSRVTIERAPTPRYAERGDGAYFVDADGRRILDLNNNYTTLIHGHGFAPVVEAVTRQLRDGSCFANPTRHEIALAELIVERVRRIDSVRFVNSGSEAVMFAIKAARAFTGRPAIAKIEGAYHGGYDAAEVGQASTPANWGDPGEPAPTPYYAGVPDAVLGQTVVLRFNDPEGARRLIGKHAAKLAAILIDPMPSRAGLVAPEPEFIAALQDSARQHGILIISDEVLNFRQSHAGAAARYGLEPDLYALGKIIGGGLPIGAIAGRTDVMKMFSADGRRAAVPQGGTFSANPLSMVAGLTAMRALDHAALAHLDTLGETVRHGLADVARDHQAPFSITGAASLFRIHPKRRTPREFRDAFPSPAEAKVMKQLWRFFQAAGVNLPDGASAALSTPMGAAEIGCVVETFRRFVIAQAASIAELDNA